MTTPCKCQCVPRPVLGECTQPAAPSPGSGFCGFLYSNGYWLGGNHSGGALHSVFPWFAPTHWTFQYWGDVVTLAPVSTGDILTVTEWQSPTYSRTLSAGPAPGTRTYYFRLTISGTAAGDVHVEQVFTSHPDGDFPASIHYYNLYPITSNGSGALNMALEQDDEVIFPLLKWMWVDGINPQLRCDVICTTTLTATRWSAAVPGTRYNRVNCTLAWESTDLTGDEFWSDPLSGRVYNWNGYAPPGDPTHPYAIGPLTNNLSDPLVWEIDPSLAGVTKLFADGSISFPLEWIETIDDGGVAPDFVQLSDGLFRGFHADVWSGGTGVGNADMRVRGAMQLTSSCTAPQIGAESKFLLTPRSTGWIDPLGSYSFPLNGVQYGGAHAFQTAGSNVASSGYTLSTAQTAKPQEQTDSQTFSTNSWYTTALPIELSWSMHCIERFTYLNVPRPAVGSPRSIVTHPGDWYRVPPIYYGREFDVTATLTLESWDRV